MTWSALQLGPYTHWADIPLATAWFGECIARGHRTGYGAKTSAGGDWFLQPWAAQRDDIRGVWEALAQGFRALNLPVLASPIYRQAQLTWLGAVATDTPSLQAAIAGPLTAGYPGTGGTMRSRLVDQYNAVGNLFQSGDVLCGIIVRLSIASQDGTVITQCMGPRDDSTATDSRCVYTGTYTGCGVWGQNGPTRSRACDPYTSAVSAWADPPAIGIASGTTCKITHALPALQWFVDWALDVASQVLAIGVQGSLIQAIAYVLKLDLDQAGALNLSLGDYAAATAGLATSQQTLQWSHNTDQGQMKDATVAALKSTPYTSWLAPILDAAPLASATIVDPFGLPVVDPRQTAAFQFPYLQSSGQDGQTQPTLIVPAPPSYGSAGDTNDVRPQLSVDLAPWVQAQHLYAVGQAPQTSTTSPGTVPTGSPATTATGATTSTGTVAAIAGGALAAAGLGYAAWKALGKRKRR